MTKERIKQFIDYKGIKLKIFFEETGIKRGFLDKDKLNGTVSDEHFAKIIATYPDANIEWFITGKGEMMRNISKNAEKCTVCLEKDKKITALQDKLIYAQEKIIQLQSENNEIKKYSGVPPAKIVGVVAAG